MLLNIIKNSVMLDSQNMLNINETTNGIYILVKGISIDDAKMFTSEIHGSCARTTGA